MKPKCVPFDYSIRTSKRVRSARIVIKPYQGLEVVIPPRFPKKQIPRILQQHEDWITKQLEKHANCFQPPMLPDALSIRMTDQNYAIEYRQNDQTTHKPRIHTELTTLTVNYQTQEQAIESLRHWVRSQAIELLTPALKNVKEEFGFDYKRVSIRSQKSRWGSCSNSGTISLNDQLLFMPKETVRYLMIHELCHTRHMNHSNKFWQLVEQCCPEFKQHELNLMRGREIVPDWFQHSLHNRS